MVVVVDFLMFYFEVNVKNFFVCDDKYCYYYLVMVKGEKWVDLKVLSVQEGIWWLSFVFE